MASRTSTAGKAFAQLKKRLKPSALPAHPEPMLCTLVAEPFNNPEWIFEPKLDGLRILGHFDGKELTLLSRNQLSQNFQFPDIVAALQKSLKRPALVDGEVVCFDDQGRSSFRALQQRFHLQDEAEVQARMRKYPAYLYLFDLLYYDGYDLTSLPLESRKQILREAVHWSDRVRWTECEANDGEALLRQACQNAEEGIIGKHRQSRYVGGRSDAWVKLKCLGKQEFVIGGFTDPQRSRVGLGALVVGYYTPDGKQLRYAGKVGTGFTRDTLLDLRKQLDKLEQSKCPFDEKVSLPRATLHWVRPKLVAEIAFGEWTQNGLLRQPRYEGLRADKKPQECRRERPKAIPPEARKIASAARNRRRSVNAT